MLLAKGKNVAIEGVEQPKLLEINKYLRLRKYEGYHDFVITKLSLLFAILIIQSSIPIFPV